MLENFSPDPPSTATEAHPTEQCCIDEKQNKCFVIVQAKACGQPRTVVVHFQHTSPTCRAVMCSIGFGCMTFFAIAGGAGRGNRNGLDDVQVMDRFNCREDGVFDFPAGGSGLKR